MCMGCNDPYYTQQWEDVKETWAKDIIDGKYPDIDIIMYTSSGNNEYFYNQNEHILYVPCNDSLIGTFEKTVKAFQSLEMFGAEYEYILRTNCSTIINVKLLDAFIHSDAYNKNKIYTGRLFFNGEKSAPFKTSLIYPGNFLLFDKHYINLINFTSVEMVKQIMDSERIIHKDLFAVDDLTICAVLNTYLNANGLDPYNIYQPVPTQHLIDFYTNKNITIYGNVMAIFNKIEGDTRPIREYYNECKIFLNDFYSNYYNLLSDNVENLKDDFEVLKNVEMIVEIESGKFEKNIYSFKDLKNKRE